MTPTRASAIAALVATLTLTAFAPAAFAEQRGGRPGDQAGMHKHRVMDFRQQQGGNGRFQIVDFRCGTGAADRMENRYERFTERLTLTAEQQTLFDTFRTSALTAQTSFADACATIRPDTAADRTTPPDPIARLETRLKIDEARLAAMKTVLPDLKAFFASLTDEQKSAMAPNRRGERSGEMRGRNKGGFMHHGKGGAPGAAPAPVEPAAPAAPPAPGTEPNG